MDGGTKKRGLFPVQIARLGVDAFDWSIASQPDKPTIAIGGWRHERSAREGVSREPPPTRERAPSGVRGVRESRRARTPRGTLTARLDVFRGDARARPRVLHVARASFSRRRRRASRLARLRASRATGADGRRVVGWRVERVRQRVGRDQVRRAAGRAGRVPRRGLRGPRRDDARAVHGVLLRARRGARRGARARGRSYKIRIVGPPVRSDHGRRRDVVRRGVDFFRRSVRVGRRGDHDRLDRAL